VAISRFYWFVVSSHWIAVFIMGGAVVSSISRNAGTADIHRLDPCKGPIKSAPSIGHSEMVENLSICTESWNRIVSDRVNGIIMAHVFQQYVFVHLRNLRDARGVVIAKMIAKSQKSRSKNPIITVIKFVLSLGAHKEDQVSILLLELIGTISKLSTLFTVEKKITNLRTRARQTAHRCRNALFVL
jgi:hypothetical protein